MLFSSCFQCSYILGSLFELQDSFFLMCRRRLFITFFLQTGHLSGISGILSSSCISMFVKQKNTNWLQSSIHFLILLELMCSTLSMLCGTASSTYVCKTFIISVNFTILCNITGLFHHALQWLNHVQSRSNQFKPNNNTLISPCFASLHCEG